MKSQYSCCEQKGVRSPLNVFHHENGVFMCLNKKALDCLSSPDVNEIKNGKKYLLQMLQISPNDDIVLYNLACADSLLKNTESALINLERSIDAGYRNLDHLLSDADFENIKNTEKFSLLVKKLRSILEGSKFQYEEPKVENPQVKIENPKVESNDSLDQLLALGLDLPADLLKEMLKQCGSVENVVLELFK